MPDRSPADSPRRDPHRTAARVGAFRPGRRTPRPTPPALLFDVSPAPAGRIRWVSRRSGLEFASREVIAAERLICDDQYSAHEKPPRVAIGTMLPRLCGARWTPRRQIRAQVIVIEAGWPSFLWCHIREAGAAVGSGPVAKSQTVEREPAVPEPDPTPHFEPGFCVSPPGLVFGVHGHLSVTIGSSARHTDLGMLRRQRLGYPAVPVAPGDRPSRGSSSDPRRPDPGGGHQGRDSGG